MWNNPGPSVSFYLFYIHPSSQRLHLTHDARRLRFPDHPDNSLARLFRPTPEDLLPGGKARGAEYWENYTFDANSTLRSGYYHNPSLREVHSIQRRGWLGGWMEWSLRKNMRQEHGKTDRLADCLSRCLKNTVLLERFVGCAGCHLLGRFTDPCWRHPEARSFPCWRHPDPPGPMGSWKQTSSPNLANHWCLVGSDGSFDPDGDSFGSIAFPYKSQQSDHPNQTGFDGFDQFARRMGYDHLATSTRYGNTCCASCGSVNTAELVKGTGVGAKRVWIIWGWSISQIG